jgi:hypothetical protein
MWQIDNRTPFAAAQGWVRDRNGAEVWIVAIKCTFDIQPDGSAEVSKQQSPVFRVPEYNGEPGRSSLRFESDLVLTKTTTDIIIAGHAAAPAERPVTELDVGFRIGSIQKVLKVFGDRIWRASGLSAPQPFIKIPIVYERAFGGVDHKSEHPEVDWEWHNPVGTGFAVSESNIAGMLAPNIEYPDTLITSWNDKPPPAGFGPVGSSWQPRASFSGTYGDEWSKSRQPLLPDDFDDRFFQCAPADQQAAQFLRGGEAVALLNLCRVSKLHFVLPEIEFALETRFTDGERREHETPKLHTVVIETDVPRVSLTWHSAIECHAKVYKLKSTRIRIRSRDLDGENDEPVDDLLDLV